MRHWPDWKTIDLDEVAEGDTVTLEDGTTARLGPSSDPGDGFVKASIPLTRIDSDAADTSSA